MSTVVIHNQIAQCPHPHRGADGFRWWLAKRTDKLEVCPCGWRPNAAPHYRERITLPIADYPPEEELTHG